MVLKRQTAVTILKKVLSLLDRLQMNVTPV